MVESGPLRASVKISVPLGEHGDLTLIATVVTETPYVSFKADVSRNFLPFQFEVVLLCVISGGNFYDCPMSVLFEFHFDNFRSNFT